MPLIEGFAHRQELADIVARWTVNRPQSGDVLRLKQIVNFNFYVARMWVGDLASALLADIHGITPAWTRIRTKGELKDLAVEHPSYTDARIDELRARYQRFPEDFYRETPVDGGHYTIVSGSEPRLVGSTRIKRSRRIAEKGARRMVDFIFDHIRASADDLAGERAEQLGIQLDKLVTPQALMVEEFRHAERRVIKQLKQGAIQDELEALSIPDVVGIKLIVEDGGLDAVLALLTRTGIRVIEVERHDGLYRATNIRLAYLWPREHLQAAPPAGHPEQVLVQRGLPAATLQRDYLEFIDDAEDEIGVELIVCSFREFVESEIGRCMHEERVLVQRAQDDYTGHLATNIRYFMDYIFALCRSPGLTEIDDVPIKLWVRYMPETIEQLRAELLYPQGMTLDAPSSLPPGGTTS